MSNLSKSGEDSSALSSIFLKREAAKSLALPGVLPASRPPSASSSGSFQMIPGAKDLLSPARLDMAVVSKRESGGGVTGEKNEKLMSVLVDSRAVSSSKKSSSGSTPKSLAYQLYFITSHMIDSNDICGGKISSKLYDVFCGKSVSTCKTKSHQNNRHSWCKENTVFIIGRSNSVGTTSSEKIINPEQYHIHIPLEHYNQARKLLKTFNGKLFAVRNYEKACLVFNEFCKEFLLDTHIGLDETRALDFENIKGESATNFSNTDSIMNTVDTGTDFGSMNISEKRDIVGVNSMSSSDSSSQSSNDSELSTGSNDMKLPSKFQISDDVEDKYIMQGLQFGLDFDKNPTKQISLLGAYMLKQDDTIARLTKAINDIENKPVVSEEDLEQTLYPIRSNVRAVKSIAEHTKSSFNKYKKKYSEDKLKSFIQRQLVDEVDHLVDDKFAILREDIEAIDPPDFNHEIFDRLQKIETRMAALNTAPPNSDLFSPESFTSPLIPDVVRNNISGIEFKLALLESRVGAQMLKFNNITLQSLVDTELFVNDHVPSFSYCFFDLVALLDSLRDTNTTEKSFLESEYNAQKTKFVSVDEASTSASFLHVAPLVFSGTSSTSDSKYGSIERSLPNVKSRDHWVSLGGMEGMKRQLEEEVLSKVISILEEIPMTLGDSKGASLVKSFLMSSQTCFNKFVNWTETLDTF